MADVALPYVWNPTPRDRLRDRAHADVLAAIKRGLLLPPETLSCADCGAPAFCYDHRNYYKPLKVDPVCQGCNIRRGPAHPIPSEIDCSRDRNDLKPKGKGIRAAAGARWHMDEGEGWILSESPLHVAVNWRDLDEQQDLDAEFRRNEASERIAANRAVAQRLKWHNGGKGRGWSMPSAIKRYEYFKAHDPWRPT